MIFEKQVVNMYKGMMHTRCDDTETVFYFSSENFPGLKKESYAFRSSLGHTLQGYIYEYENPISSRLVVFDHGFGGGHLAYMKEIELLARHGYRVFAYDHTGCMESGGESPNGLSQSLSDLNDCIIAIKGDDRFSGTDISVMGHSWGAFSTLNIAMLHPEISHIVAISGFVSVTEMIGTFFSGLLKGYRKPVLALESSVNPEFFGFDARKSLADSDTKALLIYSDNDKLCRKKHFDLLKSALDGKENVKLLLVSGKGHNPNYTAEAVKYLGSFSKARAKLMKKKNLSAEDKARFVASFDWERMTEQDEKIWSEIFTHLDKN
ncbi:MAG: alpha/beta hydrolase [Ruminococcaceae bacterium]|nr:alpha/beta hydrolase [Oscillospiraceae bacterium]